MLKHRIIPVLLWDGKTAVQTTKFKNIRPVGSMEQHIEVMESRNIDELIILDIAAIREEREPNFELIKRYASKLFCPVTYGGGISSIDHVSKLIQECGVDKVAIRTYTKVIPDAVNKFGVQAVVLSIDARSNKIIPTSQGAGEVLINIVERNGTQTGYSRNYIYTAVYKFNVPIIINGGCGTPEDMIEAIQCGANAVAASSMFLFTEHTPRSCARALQEAGLPVRVDG